MTKQQFVDTVGFWNITARQGSSNCGSANTAVMVYHMAMSVDITKFNKWCDAEIKRLSAIYSKPDMYGDIYAQQIVKWCQWASNKNVVEKPEWI